MHALHKLLLFHVLTCLGPNADGSEIINGKNAPDGSMLYMVSLQNGSGSHVCGGFLIREDFVVTAAHCDSLGFTRVVVGTHNLKRGGKIMNIEERHKHPRYESPGNGNDIMLLKLSVKAGLDNTVQTIQLPSPGINLREKEMCSVAGWGYIKTDGVSVDDLRVVDVPIISRKDCEAKWKNLPTNVICAGGYPMKEGFCQGDSGGPLVCNGIPVGVVSFNYNYNCTYPNVPNVYVELSKYLDWIKTIVKE